VDPGVVAAIRALEAGRVVVYPTETVYGLGVDAASSTALAELARIKGRTGDKGVSVLVETLAAATALLDAPVPEAAIRLADAFWPGPLTLVLPAAEHIDPWLLGPGGGVGLRCSTDPLARALVAGFGRPLTSTSANPSGLPPAGDVGTARRYFGDEVGAYIDGGRRDATVVSSVVEFFRGSAILRRVGAIDVKALSSVTPIKPLEQ